MEAEEKEKYKKHITAVESQLSAHMSRQKELEVMLYQQKHEQEQVGRNDTISFA